MTPRRHRIRKSFRLKVSVGKSRVGRPFAEFVSQRMVREHAHPTKCQIFLAFLGDKPLHNNRVVLPAETEAVAHGHVNLFARWPPCSAHSPDRIPDRDSPVSMVRGGFDRELPARR